MIFVRVYTVALSMVSTLQLLTNMRRINLEEHTLVVVRVRGVMTRTRIRHQLTPIRRNRCQHKRAVRLKRIYAVLPLHYPLGAFGLRCYILVRMLSGKGRDTNSRFGIAR